MGWERGREGKGERGKREKREMWKWEKGKGGKAERGEKYRSDVDVYYNCIYNGTDPASLCVGQ